MYQFIERSLRGAFHITQKYSNSIKKYVNSLDEKKKDLNLLYMNMQITCMDGKCRKIFFFLDILAHTK